MYKGLKINLICKAKRAYALFAFILFINKVTSQINLIPNPSFEDSLGIPVTSNQLDSCKNWYNSFGSVDYFSKYSPINYLGNCGVNIPRNDVGFQNPHSGNFYIGLSPYIQYPQSAGYPNFSLQFELLGTKLNQKLLSNHVYDFKLYYSLANSSKLISNQFSAYFSVNQYTINSGSFIPNSQLWYDSNINNINPQVNNDTTQFLINDSLNWSVFGDCFLANGGEEFITIGNLRDNKFNKTLSTNFTFSTTSCNANNFGSYMYMYIDDVSLYDLGYYSGKAQCKNDTVICFNTSIAISNNIKDSSSIVWQAHPSLSCTNCPNPIATPTVTTKYYITKTLCSFITKDSITVTVITPSVIANAGINDTICLSKNTRLGTADSTYFTNYVWQPNINLSCFNCAMPYANPISNITYTLQRSQCNVTNSSTVFVKVEDCAPIFTIPNIFTPNGDGVNDAWGVNFSNTQYIKNFQLNIFNRWGTPILQTPNESQKENSKINLPSIKWDGHTTSGEACVDGIYFYIINFELNGEKKTFKGNVTLIR
jgi:gliding motility-associated-like protein